ncbi:MAG: DEAD/DEAH box helicase [Alphaproteobacteria bacterium]|nr:DEAD/DEAH box helicase [Alphaproteobacteria bacterium]
MTADAQAEGGDAEALPSQPVVAPQRDEGAQAVRLAAAEPGREGVLYLARGEARAERLERTLAGLFPALRIIRLPAWDCLPYDRSPPSRETMGRRIAAVAALAERGDEPLIVIASAEAALQRLPPHQAALAGRLTLSEGEALDPSGLAATLDRFGYAFHERVDEPGEAVIRGEVVDLFPPALERPCRIEHADGRIIAIHLYDPATQRSIGAVERVEIGPASELIFDSEGCEGSPARFVGAEHWLPLFYPALETVFDLVPRAALAIEPEVEERAIAFREQIEEAHDARRAFRRAETGEERRREPLAPNRLYLDDAEWQAGLAGRTLLSLSDPGDIAPVPRFAQARSPADAFRNFVQQRLDAGGRVLLAASADGMRRRLLRLLRRSAQQVPAVADWAEAQALPEGGLATIAAAIEEGFETGGLTFVAAADVVGPEAALQGEGRDAALPIGDAELRLGDAVIHEEHGVGVLAGLDTVVENDIPGDCLRLEYQGGARLLVPIEEIERVWRYGSEASGVTLDRLGSDSWNRRRQEVDAQIAETARALVATTRQRAAAIAPKIVPPTRPFAQFVRRFPYIPTADQARAVDETLADLAAGSPMERLICGDVGYGKTEVALRAAAAAALAGRQVAVVAPTTVLARQHLQTFRRRFAGLGVEIAGLSRLTPAAEARRVREGLAEGSIAVVIGTHAVTARSVRFKDLALLIVDEEQRFGARQKRAMRKLGSGVHQLTMTATPIPRTLQTALVGLRALSLIATPPARRAPVRTFVLPLDKPVIREALLRERRRGGQSFVVCPRIADLPAAAAMLHELAPDLEVREAHGRMEPEALDEAMLGFADGDGDVLLTTNIIETGLDVPAANTMIVLRPDRFGLAQLHQLRGRVGRGHRRAVLYLMTEPGQRLAAATAQRLQALAAAEQLGAGFAISARDLDLRGAGDLTGEAQAGHMKLIGVELYQHLLDRALVLARGERPAEDWQPVLRLGVEARLPEDYVPEPEMRIGLYRRLHRLGGGEIDDFAEEIEDRFGPAPSAVGNALAVARLREQCRALGIAVLEAGPQAVAAAFRDLPAARAGAERAADALEHPVHWHGERLIFQRPGPDGETRLAACRDLLQALAAAVATAVADSSQQAPRAAE